MKQELLTAVQGAREMLDSMLPLLDSIDNTVQDAGYQTFEQQTGIVYSQIIKLELTKFAVTIVNADGDITKEETECFDMIFRYDGFTAADIKHLINSNDSMTVKSGDVPMSLQRAVALDNILYANSITSQRDQVSQMIIQMFNVVGTCAASCNDAYDAREVQVYNSYLDGLKRYVNGNLR